MASRFRGHNPFSVQLQADPSRSIFVQQLLARALQNNGRPSRSVAESADIASAPIIAALLAKQDQKAQAQQMTQQKALANQLVGGAMRTNIPLENLPDAQGNPQAPDNFSVPTQGPTDPTRQALAGILAQNPQMMGQMAMQQAMPPKPAMTPYEQAQIGISQQNANRQQQLGTEAGQRADQQIELERQRLKLQQQQAAASTDPLGLGNAPQPGQAQAPKPHGDDFLQTLPENIATQVKSIAEGKLAFPTGYALTKPYWQQMLAAVAQYDPNFDAVNYNARSKTRNAFSAGPEARTINNLNTAIGHAGNLLDAIPGTASHGGFPFATTVNSIENAVSSSMGKPGVPVFKDTAGKLAQELTAVYRGSGGAERDVVRGLESLDANASAETKKAILGNAVDLLNSKLESLGSQYNQGMGTSSDPLQLLNEKAQATFQRLKGGGSGGGDAGGNLIYDPATKTFKKQ